MIAISDSLHRLSWMSLCFVLCSTAWAKNASSGPPSQIGEVKLGFNGLYKVGFWTPVQVTLHGGESPVEGTLELTTSDGDSVSVSYTQSAEKIFVGANKKVTVQRYVRFGRVRSGLQVRWRDESGETVIRNFSSQDLNPALFSYQRLAVTLGKNIVGIDDAIRLLGQNEADAIQQVAVNDARELPSQWFGYEGVNLLIIPTTETRFINELTAEQVNAIRHWVKLGGRVFFSVGANGKDILGSGKPFAEFAPGEFHEVVMLRRTSGLEHYVNARTRLDVAERGPAQPLAVASLNNIRGKVEVFEGAGIAGEVPLVIRSWYGLGYVLFVAFDLDQPPLSKWAERPKLIGKLLQEAGRRVDDDSSTAKQSRVVHLGYDDLVGQLRGALEQFPGVTFISFSMVAAVIIVYVLLLGPADFFALRVLRRPEATWLTFPALVLVFAGIAWGIFKNTKSDQIKINQVEVVDVDVESQVIRGTSWAHVYAPTSDGYDMSLRPEAEVWIASHDRPMNVLTAWQGLPGRGFGGLNGNTTSGLLAAGYELTLSLPTEKSATHASLKNLLIPVASTKSLAGRWWGEVPLSSASTLTANTTRDDFLRGTISNPLNIDLRDCSLLFGSSIYILDETLKPGQALSMDAQGGKRRDLERRLTRRRVTHETKEEISAWDEANLDVPRILEIMMFHEAAGGQPYTKLAHRYQSYVDLSEHLRLGRAVLVGRSESPAATWTRGDKPLLDQPTKHWTYCRIVFPVSRGK